MKNLLLRLTGVHLDCSVCDTADDAKFDWGLLAFTLRSLTQDAALLAGLLMFAMRAPY